MESIHIKTVDPISQDLLRIAASRGLELSWERYESQQPQDGFLRSGLSCAFGCLQGPCRIDPFGRGSTHGICGMGRDEMVAASLLRLCLNGALEAGECGEGTAEAAMMLSRPQGSVDDLVGAAVALGVSAFDASGDAKGVSGAFKVGYGVLAASGPVVGVCGSLDDAIVAALVSGNGRGRVVSLGDWISADGDLLDFACSSGEAELAIASGCISLVVCGAGADPSIKAICDQAGVPVVAAAEAVEAAATAPHLAPQAEQVGAGAVCAPGDIAGGSLCLIGGADMPQQSMGWLASELPGALTAAGQNVAVWGDAALWAVKAGSAGVQVLDPVRGVSDACVAVGPDLKGICFTGLSGCRDLAVALGAAASGTRVCVATPLPVWGSEAVCDALDRVVGEAGGEFAHYDHPASADEILAWFG
ncbi:MAG: hypothetical protein HN403_08310 [Rhodospirillales bacterium]|nr:hypothetical protein [Rhodospirillales bacterium]